MLSFVLSVCIIRGSAILYWVTIEVYLVKSNQYETLSLSVFSKSYMSYSASVIRIPHIRKFGIIERLECDDLNARRLDYNSDDISVDSIVNSSPKCITVFNYFALQQKFNRDIELCKFHH